MVSDERKDRISEDRIGVVIVTFNNEGTINQCLESILKFDPHSKIVVVDNNSSDQSQDIVEKFGKKVTLIKSEVNLGFAKANNLGASYLRAEYIVFLNPDTILLQEKSLENLQEVLVENSNYGLISPKLVFPDGRVQKSVRYLPTATKAFEEYILGIKGAYDFYLPDCSSLCEVESITGACMVIKKDVFEKAGKFNEEYFMYFEDLELCKSMKKLGLKVGFLPTVAIKHIVGVSGKNQEVSELLHASARKYHGFLSYSLIQGIIRLGKFVHYNRFAKTPLL